MGCCNSYPPCQANDANVCDPLGTTDAGYKVVVEDISFCQKTIAQPTNVSALQYDSTSLINWSSKQRSILRERPDCNRKLHNYDKQKCNDRRADYSKRRSDCDSPKWISMDCSIER